ncbi:MAG: 1-(5-phosphoribosyl)-5-[(5-phosphoribosylamino)methylideneamino]imidazole-4-carboxamide isomerase [Verrucomicrobia bacterium]|nr:1-(5-phosphoribosyl)-5-[(5-phosphoribosylamino)methylideneamino]imidazole-4-carboxamide isomerase [Verrucomicrobiota bacterium]
MIILPAIDLKDGKCVRLKQGRAEDVTVYSDDPVAMARDWVSQGAEYLHLVDLDGAFEGRPMHAEVIRDICTAINVPVEMGGGLRTDDDIALMLAAGVDRLIIGTRAYANPEDLLRLVGRFGRHIAVGIDARDGMVQVKGWTETTSQTAVDLALEMEKAGVQTIIYTDTARDGMLKGVNVEAMDALCKAVSCDIIASGGVSTVEDVKRLKELDRKNLSGAIVGKALYEGAVSLRDMLNASE